MRAAKVLMILVLVISLAAVVWAAEGKRTAKIISIDGNADVKLAGQTNWSPASVDMVLNEGDTLRTDAKSFALVNVNGIGQTATVEVKEGSELLLAELLIDQQSGSHRTMLDLASGEILIKAQKVKSEDSKFEVKTPTSIVGVRGTTFAVKVEAMEE